MMDYRKLCIEIFGTDDEMELREIAGRQRSGRKKALSKKDTEAIIEMQQQGKTTKEIAEHLGKTIEMVRTLEENGIKKLRLPNSTKKLTDYYDVYTR